MNAVNSLPVLHQFYHAINPFGMLDRGRLADNYFQHLGEWHFFLDALDNPNNQSQLPQVPKHLLLNLLSILLHPYLQKICFPILLICGLDQIHALVAVAGLK